MNISKTMEKVVIVTGAGSGLGYAMTRALLQERYRVVAVDRHSGRIKELIDQSGEAEGNLLPMCVDLSDSSSSREVVDKAIAAFGTIHALVNNAGVSNAIVRPNFRHENVMFWDVPEDKWDTMFDINVKAPFLLAKAAVPFMIEQKWGRIVNVTTSLDTMIRPAWTPYGPSKAALEAASSNWAGDLRDKGVTVNILIPGGPANTNLVPISEAERSKLIQPEVMGPPIKWLLSEASDGTTARRFIAYNWDQTLKPEEAAKQASYSIAWESLGRQAATEPVPRQ